MALENSQESNLIFIFSVAAIMNTLSSKALHV